jgi:transposase
VPKPSHLRSVNPTPAHAARGAARRPSGVAVEAEPTPLGSVTPAPAPSAQGVAGRPSGVAVEAEPTPLGSVTPAPAPSAQRAARHPSGVSVETLPKRGKRRSFSAAEKLRIVRLAAACTKRGDVEALLRREGIYSSHLTGWRKQLVLHGSEALAEHKPGRKPKLDAKDRRIAELEQRATRLEAKLSLAEKLIDLQKKVSAILGINLATDGES